MDLPPVPCRVLLACWSGAIEKEGDAYVAAGEVTTLEHEVWDDTVELGALEAEAQLASAEGGEVLYGLWDNIVVELEVDTSGLLW